jgi:TonB family protein
MKTFSSPGGSQIRGRSNNRVADEAEYMWLCKQRYPVARRRALLSIIPGLGQLSNGELTKGTLFLLVTLSNVVIVLSLALGQKLSPLLSQLAAVFQRQPNWSLAAPWQTEVIQSPALLVYCGLVIWFVAYAMMDAYDRASEAIRHGRRYPKIRLSLPEAASGSYLVHFSVITFFVLCIILFVTPLQQTPQITQIELVPPKPKPKPPEPPKPRAEKPKPVVVPQEKPQPVRPQKVEPPKPMPVAVAVPTSEPSPLSVGPVESAAPPPPSAPSGEASGGGSPTGGAGDADVDMGPYMRQLQQCIKAHWYPPKGNEDKRVKVSFKIHNDGHVSHLKLISSSGVQSADEAATQAVEDAGKAGLPPLPRGAGSDVDINFTFDYHVFGSGKRSHLF